MAYADYLHCAVCDSKALYDADVNYEASNTADIAALCWECSHTYRIVITGPSGGHYGREVRPELDRRVRMVSDRRKGRETSPQRRRKVKTKRKRR